MSKYEHEALHEKKDCNHNLWQLRDNKRVCGEGKWEN